MPQLATDITNYLDGWPNYMSRFTSAVADGPRRLKSNQRHDTRITNPFAQSPSILRFQFLTENFLRVFHAGHFAPPRTPPPPLKRGCPSASSLTSVPNDAPNTHDLLQYDTVEDIQPITYSSIRCLILPYLV